MITSSIKVMASFGEAKVSVGAGQAKGPDGPIFWYISIKEIKNAQGLSIADKVEKTNVHDDNEIILTFTEESHMVKVMAAFTKLSDEAMLEEWKKFKNKMNESGKE